MSKIAYFDNAATTFPKPDEVYTYMDYFYREYGVNVGRGQHKLAAHAASLVVDTRTLLQTIFHCPNKKVIFTHTATESLNIILQGLPICNGSTIYISPFEHNSVTRVLDYLQKKYQINIIILSVNRETLSYNLLEIAKQFCRNSPDYVVVNHASNVCGLLAPIHEICSLAKKQGATTIIDMCQTAGLIDTDLSNENIDFAVFAGHKTLYGPLGIGCFICSGSIKPMPLLYGGTGIDSANQSMPDSIPERYEVASPNIQAISGLYAALKWNITTGIDNIRAKEKENHIRLLELLSRYKNITTYVPDINSSIGVVSCLFDGYGSDNIGNVLSEKNVAIRSGLHCSPYAHQFLGTAPAGTVRFSVSYHNNDSDFAVLEQALSYIYENS